MTLVNHTTPVNSVVYSVVNRNIFLPVWVRRWALRWDDFPYTFMQPGCGQRWFLVLSPGFVTPRATTGGGVVSLRGVARSGDTGRDTVSCLTRVRSVKILVTNMRKMVGHRREDGASSTHAFTPIMDKTIVKLFVHFVLWSVLWKIESEATFHHPNQQPTQFLKWMVWQI